MKILVTVFLFCGLQLAAQDMQSCPMHKEHMNGSQRSGGCREARR